MKNRQKQTKSPKKLAVVATVVWIFLTLGMLSMNFLPNNLINGFVETAETPSPDKPMNNSEYRHFRKDISDKIQSIDHLIDYVECQSFDKNNPAERIEVVVKTIRKRFVHAYGIYGLKENWMAVLAGKFIWHDLSAKVIPDDILKGPAAACSQVSIVIMSALREMGIHTRRIELKGHYTLEAYANNQWFYIDADMKPDFNNIGGRKSLSEILSRNEQFELYRGTTLDSSDVVRMFSSVKYGKPNEYPAPNAYAFHLVTKVLSHWGWLLPLFLALRASGLLKKLLRKHRQETLINTSMLPTV